MPTERPLHYPVEDDHPNVIPGSLFRPVICNQARSSFLDESLKKETGKPVSFYENMRLGFNFRADEQAYYTLDKDRVTCKLCLHKLDSTGRQSRITNLKKKISLDKERLRKLSKQMKSDSVELSGYTYHRLPDNYRRIFIDRLKGLRKQQGLSQTKMCELTGLGKIYRDLESGKKKVLNLEHIHWITNVLGIRLSTVIREIEDEFIIVTEPGNSQLKVSK